MNKIELIKSQDLEYKMLKYIKDNFQSKPYSLIAYELNKMGYKNKNGNDLSRFNIKDILKYKLKLSKKEDLNKEAIKKFELNKNKINNIVKATLNYSDSKISSVLNTLELFTQTGKEWTVNYLCQYRLNNKDFKKFEYFGRNANIYKKSEEKIDYKIEKMMLQTIKDNLDKADYEIVEILNNEKIKPLKALKWTKENLYHYRISRNIHRTSIQDKLIKSRGGAKKKYYNINYNNM